MAGYAVSQLEEMPDVPTFTDPGDPAWKPIQHYLGLTAFGINAFVAKAAGDTIAPPHDEADFGQEEVYLVMAGHARVTVDGEATVFAVGCAPGCFRTSWRPAHFENLARHPAVDG